MKAFFFIYFTIKPPFSCSLLFFSNVHYAYLCYVCMDLFYSDSHATSTHEKKTKCAPVCMEFSACFHFNISQIDFIIFLNTVWNNCNLFCFFFSSGDRRQLMSFRTISMQNPMGNINSWFHLDESMDCYEPAPYFCITASNVTKMDLETFYYYFVRFFFSIRCR